MEHRVQQEEGAGRSFQQHLDMLAYPFPMRSFQLSLIKELILLGIIIIIIIFRRILITNETREMQDGTETNTKIKLLYCSEIKTIELLREVFSILMKKKNKSRFSISYYKLPHNQLRVMATIARK